MYANRKNVYNSVAEGYLQGVCNGQGLGFKTLTIFFISRSLKYIIY